MVVVGLKIICRNQYCFGNKVRPYLQCHHTGLSVPVLSTLIPVDLPAKARGKAAKNSPSNWATATIWETRMEFLTLDQSDQAVASGHWDSEPLMYQWMKNFLLLPFK